MKAIRVLILIAIFFITGCGSNIVRLNSDKAEWDFVLHSANVNVLKEQIAVITNKGFTPMGIDVESSEGTYILYLSSKDYPFEGFDVIEINNPNPSEVGVLLSQKMGEGWVPKGISFTGNKLYVLLLKIEQLSAKWDGIKSCKANIDEANKLLNEIEAKGGVPMDISAWDGQALCLALNIASIGKTGWAIKSYDYDDTLSTFKSSVSREISAGNIPWGMSKRGDKILIMYKLAYGDSSYGDDDESYNRDDDYDNNEKADTIFTAAENGEYDKIVDYVKNGADVNKMDWDNRAALHYAARKGYLNIVEFLISKGATVDILNSYGETPLHLAAWEGRLDVVKFLIDKGAKVDAQTTPTKYTVLHYAILAGYIDVTKYLLSKGASLTLETTDGYNALDHAQTTKKQDLIDLIRAASKESQ